MRDALGIEVRDGVVMSHFPRDQVLKGLRRVAGDLRSEQIKVKDVYDAEDRRKYIGGFSSEDLPDPETRMKEPVPLAELEASSPRPTKTPAPSRRKRRKAPRDRTAVVPSTCPINPSSPRINNIFNELTTLDADTYPNAGAVLLRVFLELSVDHEITRLSLMSEEQRRKDSLSKRLKTLAGNMKDAKRISDQLHAAVVKVADSHHTIAAATVTFNQYVHNKYVHPKPGEVRTAWDELQPFLEKVWEEE